VHDLAVAIDGPDRLHPAADRGPARNAGEDERSEHLEAESDGADQLDRGAHERGLGYRAVSARGHTDGCRGVSVARRRPDCRLWPLRPSTKDR
jgi:hypothetical protein